MPSTITALTKLPRGTQAALETRAAAGNLVPFALYHTTDSQQVLFATSSSTYVRVGLLAPIPYIAINSGTGYAGSVFTVYNGGVGNWQANDVDIPGATTVSYTQTLANETSTIRWQRSDGAISNALRVWTPADLPAGTVLEWLDVRDTSSLTLAENGRATAIRCRANGALRTAVGGAPYYVSGTVPELQGAGNGRLLGPLVYQGANLSGMLVGRHGNVIARERVVSLAGAGDELDRDSFKRVALFARSSSTTNMVVERVNSGQLPLSGSATSLLSYQITPTFIHGRRHAAITPNILSPRATENFDFQRIALFGQVNGSEQGVGAISGLVITSTNLSQEDRQSLEGFMGHVYNQASNFPPAHPYKSSPRVQVTPGVAASTSVSALEASRLARRQAIIFG